MEQLITIVWLAILIVSILRVLRVAISWKTKRIRSLVYAGVIKEYQKHDRDFRETEDFRKRFRKMFRGYNLVTENQHNLKPAEVEIFYLDLVINDLYWATK